jgi:hypothetical protein
MNWHLIWKAGKRLAQNTLQHIEAHIQDWTKPASDRQITGVVSDLFRSKKDLIVENAFLRQQLIIIGLPKARISFGRRK